MSIIRIPLTQGKFAIVDDDDAYLLDFRWTARPAKRSSVWYAARTATTDRVKRNVYMHRLVVGAPQGLCVDHVNGDGLDNRKANLRLCTIGLNNVNRKTTAQSGFRGVYPNDGRYRAALWASGKKYELGNYADPTDAARAYDKKAAEVFGQFAVLNFKQQKAA